MWKIITSQSVYCVNRGGLRTSALTLLKAIGDEKYSWPERCNVLSMFKFLSSPSRKMLLLGYSDYVVFLSLPLVVFYKNNIIYFPAFHPYWTLRRPSLARLYENTFFKFFLRCKLVVCLSDYERDYFKKLYHNGNYKVLRHPSLQDISMPSFNAVRRNIIFVGRDDENKNLDFFLNLIPELSRLSADLEFIVFTDTLRKSYGDDLSKLQNLQFRTNASDEELMQAYQSSLAIIIPSKWESFSLVALEAALCGSKVIANNNVRIMDDCVKYDTIFSLGIGSAEEIVEFCKAGINQEQYADLKRAYSLDEAEKILRPYC